ncbi:MAG: choice-of-anchor J domain-containing protein, partial [Bacteroidales bacterium]|nr:choice-of-anchor J domain-containing protein [Bacteroidales bacterium]
MRKLITFFATAFMMLSLMSFGQSREVIHEETFDEDLGVYTGYSVINDEFVWHWEDYGDPPGCAHMEGYDYDAEEPTENEDWLISPPLDFTDNEQVRLTFIEAINYEEDVDGNNKVMVSTNYSGEGDPNEADWDEMEVTNRPDGDSWDFFTPDPVDLSDYDGMADVYVAFRYTSSSENAGAWEVDNIVIDEATEEEITVTSPNGLEHWIRGEAYEITWTSNNLSNDIKIELTGAESMVIEESVENTGSYNWDVPSDISLGDDYKISLSDATDGEPSDDSDTTFSIIEALYFEGFEEDLGNWSPYSVTGEQTWYHETYGERDYANMTGYDGEPLENEDWFISPAFDMGQYANEILMFESATDYDGIHLELKYSTDYDGESDPSQQGTWTDITDQANWSETDFNWVSSGELDLSGIEGSSVYVAFVYYSNPEDGASEWSIDNFKLQGDMLTGIPDPQREHNVAFYPNPASDRITVDSDGFNDARMVVYSNTGVEVYGSQMEGNKTTFELP